jgi:hypothetical protein
VSPGEFQSSNRQRRVRERTLRKLQKIWLDADVRANGAMLERKDLCKPDYNTPARKTIHDLLSNLLAQVKD